MSRKLQHGRACAAETAGARTRRRVLAAALGFFACTGCFERGPRAVATQRATETTDIAPARRPVDAGPALDASEPPDAFARPTRGRRTEPADARSMLFDPRQDEAVLASLRTEEIVGVERGRGGRSVAFRITLASGARAYFKPEQTFSGTHWNAEIAAYHLDRALGIHRTAPSTGRAVPWTLLEPAVRGETRASEVIVGADGLVRGALIAWIEERLVPIEPPPDWASALRIEQHVGVDPFVPPATLMREHAAFLAADAGAPLDSGTSLTDAGPAIAGWDRDARAAELSTLVAFDFLIHNGDRWGGSFTNVRTRGVGGPLVYLDNAAGFSRRRARLTTLDLRLSYVQRFEGAFVRRLRRLEVASFERRLGTDPLAPILDDAQLEHLEERRRALLEHVAGLVETHGADAVIAW